MDAASSCRDLPRCPLRGPWGSHASKRRHSKRRARITSIRGARRAGRMTATSATPENVRAANRYVSGSPVVTPKTTGETIPRREPAAATPRVKPANTSRAPCPNSSKKIIFPGGTEIGECQAINQSPSLDRAASSSPSRATCYLSIVISIRPEIRSHLPAQRVLARRRCSHRRSAEEFRALPTVRRRRHRTR